MLRLILTKTQSPGDVLMLTAAVRDLHRNHPSRFVTDVRTTAPELWQNNPFITPLSEDDPDVEIIPCHYPLIHESNQGPYHFIHGFIEFLSERLGVRIRPTEFKGDIYLSEKEKEWPCEVVSAECGTQSSPSPPAPLPSDGRGWPSVQVTGSAPYWIMVAGGKYDFTIKWWESKRWQAVVDNFRGRIQFIQVGAAEHHHPKLEGVIDLRGRTSIRQLIQLVHHCQGVVCPVTFLMHLAAAVPLKEFNVQGSKFKVAKSRPCVVVAGGREPVQWEAYPAHQFIHTIGALPCCAHGGCWRSRTVPLGDGAEEDRPENLCVDVVGNLPRCMQMITPEEVCRRIESYFEGGMCEYLDSGSSRGNETLSVGAQSEVLKGPLELRPAHPHPGPLPPEREREQQPAAALARTVAEQGLGIQSSRTNEERTAREIADDGELLTNRNLQERTQQFLHRIPPYPAGYEGRGIVIVGGGIRYFTCAYVCIRMLRKLGCELPIQLWHLGPDEMTPEMRNAISGFGVETMDAFEVRKSHPVWRLGGWELKPYAIIHSPFKEVLYLDADNVPVVNPSFLFDSPEFKSHGAIFWPDVGNLKPGRNVWELFGIDFREEPD